MAKITMVSECKTCAGPIEYVDCPNPYWRHTDMGDLNSPHAAKAYDHIAALVRSRANVR